MIPIVITQIGPGISNPAVFNVNVTPFSVGIGCVATGTVNYTVQHTFDDVMNIAPANCKWFNHDDPVLNGAIGNANSNYNYPIRGSQIVVNSGTGSVKATLIQAGGVG